MRRSLNSNPTAAVRSADRLLGQHQHATSEAAIVKANQFVLLTENEEAEACGSFDDTLDKQDSHLKQESNFNSTCNINNMLVNSELHFYDDPV